MKLVKKTDEYKITQRRDDRYAVTDNNGKAINGEDKVKILLAEELIKVTAPAPKEEVAEEVAEEAPAEETEAAAEEASEEESAE